MNISSLKDLSNWMTENCYNKDNYAIGGNKILEGYGIEADSEGFIWYYIERGLKKNIKKFKNVKDAAQYAYEQISKDITAKSHCIGFLKEKSKLYELESELIIRKVEY